MLMLQCASLPSSGRAGKQQSDAQDADALPRSGRQGRGRVEARVALLLQLRKPAAMTVFQPELSFLGVGHRVPAMTACSLQLTDLPSSVALTWRMGESSG